MPYSLPDVIFLFFIYSFIGWLWETVYCSIKDKRFDYRGFLFGPYCPVYGFAVTTVLIFTEPFQKHLLGLFLSGIVIATAFEYFAGWFLETFFHMKLWDYSQEFGNLKGRVAPAISLFWGFGILILVRLIQPSVMALVLRIDDWWAAPIAFLMLSDFIWTAVDTVQFHEAALVLEEHIRKEQENIRESVKQEIEDLAEQAELFSQRLAEFHLHLNDFLHAKNIRPLRFNQRRLLKNYSKFKEIDAPFVTELRKQAASFKDKTRKK